MESANELTDDPRWDGYEVPPTSNANYGWILNIVSKLSQNGVAGFLLANGALSDDGTELKIRSQLIENHLVEAIIILPRNLFYTTDISVTLWILNKNKKARVVEQNGEVRRYRNREDEILFMDLRQMGSPYEKKYIELTEEDRAKVTSVYHKWQQEGYEETYENVPEFCYSAPIDEIREKGYTLVPSRYIEFVNRDENIDFDTKMKTLQSELTELLIQEEKSKEDLLKVFEELGYGINYEILGRHIRLIDNRNREEITDRVLGISINKEFMPSVANVIGTDLSKYKLISKGKFSCNPMHVGRDERLPVALYEEDEPAIVSPAYFMFEVIDPDVLNEEYLMMWLRRTEFDRECWFHTDGSVRGGIVWDDLCRLELPILSMEKQKRIVADYKAITERIELKKQINDNLAA